MKPSYASFLLSLFALVHPLQAEIKTSVGDGSWFSSGTWTGNTVPGPGDQTTVLHNVVVDSAVTIGAGGTLSIKAPGMLSLRGGARLVVSAGAAFSASGAPGARTAVSNLDGSGVTFVTEPGGRVSMSFVDFVAVPLVLSLPALSSIEHCRFQRGSAASVSLDGESSLYLAHSTWSETAAAYALDMQVPSLPIRGVLEGNVFDRGVNFRGSEGLAIRSNLFMNAFNIEADYGSGWAEFNGNLVRNTSTWDLLLMGNTSNNLWLVDGQLVNPHFVSAPPGRDMSIAGDVFHFTGSDDNGDAILVRDTSGRLTIERVIVLPNGGGGNSGTLFSALGGPGVTVVAEHNTYFAGSQGAAVGETYGGHRSMLASFRSNIAWSTSQQGWKLYDSGGDEFVPDLVSASAADYNCGSNLSRGSNGRGYDRLEFSSGSPGLHDIDQDPRFVDPARNIVTWDASLGGAGTVGSALSSLSRVNEDGAAGAYTIANLVGYIKAGYSPLNDNLRGRAHDGGDIGAVPAGLNGLTPPPAINPTPLPTVSGSPFPDPSATKTPSHNLPPLSLRVRVRGRKASVSWFSVGAARYRLILRQRARVLSKRILRRAPVVYRTLPRGTYSVECRTPTRPLSKLVRPERVSFTVR